MFRQENETRCSLDLVKVTPRQGHCHEALISGGVSATVLLPYNQEVPGGVVFNGAGERIRTAGVHLGKVAHIAPAWLIFT